MSLPGLQLTEPVAVTASTTYELQKNTEWRFEVAFDSKVEVKLLSGTAELFGTELASQQPYTFSGYKGAIYTWYGCRLSITGDCEVEYSAEETPMAEYFNVHLALETLRNKASEVYQEGPRVLIVGPDNAGKTSLCKVLTSYAIKAGRQPIVVNLDPREGVLTVPGTLSATTFSSIIDVEEGWGSSPLSGPSPVPVKLPLVYHYCLPSPEDKPEFYKPIVSRLALAVINRLEEDPEAKEAGCIIDTPGILSQGKKSYDILQHIISDFSVNAIIVLGSERLYIDLQKRFEGRKTSMDDTVSVIKVAKSEGCVDRDDAFCKALRHKQIREYFFGDSKTTLSPHMQTVDFSQVTIYRIPESSVDDNIMLQSLLPGDADPSDRMEPIFEKQSPNIAMQNSLLAIMHAAANDTPDNVRDASVMGFLYVAEIDEEKKKLRVLAPVSGRVPNNALVWGRWPEESGDLVG